MDRHRELGHFRSLLIFVLLILYPIQVVLHIYDMLAQATIAALFANQFHYICK